MFSWGYETDCSYAPHISLRLRKTVDGVVYTYIYEGDKLMRMTVGSDVVMDFFYDHNGQPYAVNYNATKYYYVLNLQGDVVKIVTAAGNSCGTYTYDAWGNILYATNSALMNNNPLRYRGYVYDVETELYYLQSRYYDPEVGRFINADSFASTGQGVIGNNMFAYCQNNPVILIDLNGASPELSYISNHDGSINPHGIRIIQLDEDEIRRAIDLAGAKRIIESANGGYFNGIRYFKSDWKMFSNAGMSFGFVVLGSNVTDYKLIMHEYGHCLHLQDVGVMTYTSSVAIPSFIFFTLSEKEIYTGDYFSLPWEYTAEEYGDVRRGGYESGASSRAYDYWVATLLISQTAYRLENY